MIYLWVKWIHILASTLLFGTGLGIAFFLWMAHLRGNPRVIAETARCVVIADAVFTAPAVVVQLTTGLWLVHLLGMPLNVFWVKTALLLFFVVGACWLPVLWLQLKMAREVEAALAQRRSLVPQYLQWQRAWEWLGYPAFIAMLAVLFLMVNKPALWA